MFLPAVLFAAMQSPSPQTPRRDGCATPWEATILPAVPATFADSSPRILSPSAVLLRGRLAFVGNTRRPSNEQERRVVLMTAAGDTLPIPAGASTGIRPQLAAVGDTLYLAWGLPAQAPPDARSNWPFAVSAIIGAAKAPGKAWTESQVIARADDIVWHPNNPPSVYLGPDGKPHMLLAARPSGSVDRQFVDVRFRGLRFDTTTLSFGGFYASVSWRNKTGVIAFVAADKSGRNDRNSVFTSVWDSATRAWAAPYLVSFSGTSGGATSTHALVTADGAIHLVWAQSLTAGYLRPDVVRHVHSVDGGKNWSKADDIAVSAVPLPPFAIRNGVAVPYIEWDRGGPARLMVACWDQQWRQPRRASDLWRVLEFLPVPGSRRGIARYLPEGGAARLADLKIP